MTPTAEELHTTIQDLQNQVDSLNQSVNKQISTPVPTDQKSVPLISLPQGPGSLLNADMVDGIQASFKPMPHHLVPLDANGLLPPSVFPPTTVTPGTYGDGTHVGQFTVNAQGFITAASNVIIGVIGVTHGGTGTSTQFTQGSIVFAGASGIYTQNNTDLFWDNTNFRLGVGTATPGLNIAGGTNNFYSGNGPLLHTKSPNDAAMIIEATNGVADLLLINTHAALNDKIFGLRHSAGNVARFFWLNDDLTVAVSNQVEFDPNGNVGFNITPTTGFEVNLASQFDSTVNITSLSSGSVLIAGASGLVTQDATLTFNATTKTLQVSNNSTTEGLRIINANAAQNTAVFQNTGGAQWTYFDAKTNSTSGIAFTQNNLATITYELRANSTGDFGLYNIATGDYGLYLNGADKGVAIYHTTPTAGTFEVGIAAKLDSTLVVTGNVTLSGTGNSVGTITSGIWNGTVIGVTHGGTGTSTQFTQGSVVFSGASGVYNQDNSNLFWDATNHRLGLKTTAPSYTLDVSGQGRITGEVGLNVTPVNGINLYIVGQNSNAVPLLIQGSGVTSRSYGELIAAGTNSTDYNFKCQDDSGTTNYFVIRGDGNIGIGIASAGTIVDIRGQSNASLRIGAANSSSSQIIFSNAAGTNHWEFYETLGAAGEQGSFNLYDFVATATRLTVTTTGQVQFAVPFKVAGDTTGVGTALLGSNCPASTVTAPYTWVKMISSDGSTVYVPAFK